MEDVEEQAATVRIRLDVAYDGTRFAGWAKQAGGLRTVQGVLEQALEVAAGRSAGPAPRLVVAGRTDAGVHASGQVAHVDLTDAQLAALTRRHRGSGDPAAIARRLTGLLHGDGDVVVRASAVAPPGFDARFSALHRRYRYRIADRLAARDPLERTRTVVLPRALDDDLLRAAVAGVTGLHDFAPYCKPRPGATTIRELQRFSWTRQEDGVLVAEVQADAFCHNMVRNLVGASIAVGTGRIPPGRMAAMLEEGTRAGGFALAPAHGLVLVQVGYPPDGELLAQSMRTRALRTLSSTVREIGYA